MTVRVNFHFGHLSRMDKCIHGRVEGFCGECWPASADTHPQGGDVQQAPLVSGAVPDRADAQPLTGDAVTHRVDDAMVEKVARAMAVQNGRAKGNCDCKRCRAAVYFEDGNARAALEAAGVAELREALEKAEPLIETLHSITVAKDTRAIVWRCLKNIRATLTNQGKAQADG